ncbi:hypothetical protein BC938DRAFT_478470 [Jimgerdemannia flammicorona]|uniref:BTB domain-containing protein n=1 Tax=Jimgerdemannia flammicorona TaxID=994334 RepID=A0A433QMT3_9FUNG|nr:hypothetical protein BC938DRAFT_478470 [Jimgerdemannia flammicorona]
MFASGLRESYTESGSSQRTVIRVPDFDPMVFETLLRYLYSGQTKFDVDPADVFLVADKYDAPLLVGVAELRIVQSLNPDRVCRLLVTHGHMSSELREVLVWYLVSHFEEARETEGFGFMLESAKSSLIKEVMVELNGKRGSKGGGKRPRLF